MAGTTKEAKEIQNLGIDLHPYLSEVFENSNLRVLAIGDYESFENETRQLGASLVNSLKKFGLTHFALEASQPTASLCIVA